MRVPCLHFTQVDVFTTRPLSGNSLAVFLDGRGLSTARMQAIAREMNLSETTYLLPPTARGADARVRIFTVETELPFAGHPTLGTAFIVASRGPRRAEIRLQTKAGVIPVRIDRRRSGAYLEMRQIDPVFGPTVDQGRLARLLGLRPADFDRRALPQVVSTGLPFLIVPLRSSPALDRLAPDFSLLLPFLRSLKVDMAYYLVTGGHDLEARMFTPAFEDPGTGSAAGCSAAYLVRHGLRPPDRPFQIRQGHRIHRPCLITACASLAGDRAHNVRVGGYVVPVLDGRLLRGPWGGL